MSVLGSIVVWNRCVSCLLDLSARNGVKMGMGRRRRRVRIQKEGRERRLPDLLYADYLDLCGESEEDLRAMMGCFVEVCRTRGLKVNAGKRKVLVLGGD